MTDKRIYGMSEKAISDMQTHTDEDEVNDIINEQIKGKTPEKLKKEEAAFIVEKCAKEDYPTFKKMEVLLRDEMKCKECNHAVRCLGEEAMCLKFEIELARRLNEKANKGLSKEEAIDELLTHTDLSCKDCGGVERERCKRCDDEVRLNIRAIIDRIDTTSEVLGKVEEAIAGCNVELDDIIYGSDERDGVITSLEREIKEDASIGDIQFTLYALKKRLIGLGKEQSKVSKLAKGGK